jgi:hypothetical protein
MKSPRKQKDRKTASVFILQTVKWAVQYIFLPRFFDKKKTIYIHHKIEFAARYLEEDSSLQAVVLHQNQRLQG